MLMSSVGYILTRKWAARESTIAMTSWQLVAGGHLLLPFAAFVAWFSGLRHLPAATVGLVGLLNPVTGVLLGTLIAAEPFGPRLLIGAGLVVAGVLIGQRRRRVPRAARLPDDPQ